MEKAPGALTLLLSALDTHIETPGLVDIHGLARAAFALSFVTFSLLAGMSLLLFAFAPRAILQRTSGMRLLGGLAVLALILAALYLTMAALGWIELAYLCLLMAITCVFALRCAVE
jgi:hypothetical protein